MAVQQTSFSGQALNTPVKPALEAHQGGFAVIASDFQLNKQTQRGQATCSESHRISVQCWSPRPGWLSEKGQRLWTRQEENKTLAIDSIKLAQPALLPLDTGCSEVTEPPCPSAPAL